MHQTTCRHVRALDQAINEQLDAHEHSLPPSKRRRVDDSPSEPMDEPDLPPAPVPAPIQPLRANRTQPLT
ncbi:hypothetical protein FRC06_000323 [Ceratobasidium sp. 370]|nr:hypothetical protein FRC06_000323 [Ceratobasidium sp. 370]